MSDSKDLESSPKRDASYRPRRGSEIIRSRRRGAPSLDAKQIERAEWYAALEEEVFAKARQDRIELEAKPEVEEVIVKKRILPGEEEPDEKEEEVESEEDRIAREEKEKAEAAEAKAAEEEAAKQKLMNDILERNKREASRFKGGFTMELAEESEARAEEDAARKEAAGAKRPDPETYTRPANFNADSWILRISNPAQLPLHSPLIKHRMLIFPWLCGDANVYKDLAAEVAGDGIEVFGVTLPGRYYRNKEPLMTSVFQVVHNVREALHDMHLIRDIDEKTKSYKIKPMIFAGHAQGGILAFDLARLLDAEEEESEISPIQHLFVSGCNPPHIVTKVNGDRFETKYFCASGGELFSRFIQLDIPPVFLRDRKDILSSYMPIFRADYQMMEKYVFFQEDPDAELKKKEKASKLDIAEKKTEKEIKPLLRCPVTAVYGIDDNSIKPEYAHEWGRYCINKTIREISFEAEKKERETEQNLKDELDMMKANEREVRKKELAAIEKANRHKPKWKTQNKFFHVLGGGHLFHRSKLGKFLPQYIQLLRDAANYVEEPSHP